MRHLAKELLELLTLLCISLDFYLNVTQNNTCLKNGEHEIWFLYEAIKIVMYIRSQPFSYTLNNLSDYSDVNSFSRNSAAFTTAGTLNTPSP